MDTAAAPACLIDASIYIFRYYFSLPDNWFSSEGYSTAAVYGYTGFLVQLLQQQQPPVVAACFDESLGSCFRNGIYPAYKSSRALPDEALAFQLEACRRVTELLGIASFGSHTYEADDLLGTLAAKLRRGKRPIAIISRDKDLAQLLKREQDFLWDYAGNQRFYQAEIAGRFGVQPAQLVDYLALVGDSIDDIPGVPGIGAKTAQALLGRFHDIAGIFEHLDQLHTLPVRGAKKLAVKLEEHREQIAVARQLACIVENIPLEVTVAALKPKLPDVEKLAAFFQQMGFGERYVERILRVVQA